MATASPQQLKPKLPATIVAGIREYIPRYPSKQAVTLPALHMVHEHFRCVPFWAMAEIAELLDLAPAEVHDTMSFYGFFSQAPIGAKRVWFCRSISCMLRGGEDQMALACRALAIEPGQTAPDGAVTVEPAECLGVCDFAPAALCDDGTVYGDLDDAKTQMMIAGLKAESPQ